MEQKRRREVKEKTINKGKRDRKIGKQEERVGGIKGR